MTAFNHPGAPDPKTRAPPPHIFTLTMDLKDLIARMKNTTAAAPLDTPEKPAPQAWPAPAHEDYRPKISGERWRRYFEFSGEIACPAVTTTTLLQGFMEYPSIIRQMGLIMSTAGDDTADIIKLTIDGNTVLEQALGDILTTGGGGVIETVGGDTTGNLGATATFTPAFPTNQYQDFGTPPSLISQGIMIGAGETLMLQLDSYVVRQIKLTYQNVQAVEHTDVYVNVVTDRPVESKYSAAAAGSTGPGPLEIHEG